MKAICKFVIVCESTKECDHSTIHDTKYDCTNRPYRCLLANTPYKGKKITCVELKDYDGEDKLQTQGMEDQDSSTQA